MFILSMLIIGLNLISNLFLKRLFVYACFLSSWKNLLFDNFCSFNCQDQENCSSCQQLLLSSFKLILKCNVTIDISLIEENVTNLVFLPVIWISPCSSPLLGFLKNVFKSMEFQLQCNQVAYHGVHYVYLNRTLQYYLDISPFPLRICVKVAEIILKYVCFFIQLICYVFIFLRTCRCVSVDYL